MIISSQTLTDVFITGKSQAYLEMEVAKLCLPVQYYFSQQIANDCLMLTLFHIAANFPIRRFIVIQLSYFCRLAG